MRRIYPDAPIAAVGAVILDGERVLLIRRGQEPLKGEWSLPGGAVELGETLEQAICREVQEETGLQVAVTRVVEVLDRISLDDDGRVKYHYVLVDYLCKVVRGSIRCATDAVDVRWFERKNLAQAGLTEKTLDILERSFHAR